MRWLILLAALFLSACMSAGTAPDSLDRIAADYVRLQLAIGEKEPGYIDAYYGPAEWKLAAAAQPREIGDLAAATDALSARTAAIDPRALEPMALRRRAFLLAQLKAAATRLRMLGGEKLSFADEAEGLFGVHPELKPLTDYDPVLARIERLVPGEGPLPERVDAFEERFTIPKDRLQAVFDAAIAECRRRTAARIILPQDERFTLEFVTGKSWSGYNYYQGGHHSLIQINTDLPIRVDRAVDLGCHEGYPGHHALNMLLEQRLTRERGWIEYSIYPLYSPQSLIAEGSANYGIDLAFPGPARLAYETTAPYPLAGLPTKDAAAYRALNEARKDLAGARFTIAADYLEGRIDRAEAVRLTQRYQLVSKARAEQSTDFVEQYRSYVINYGLGQEMVRRHVEAAGADEASRWRAMERVISEPTLPSDLATR
jgi:hypothetical protein